MVELRFHPEAQDEYRETMAWYRARSPRSADRFEAEADRALLLVAATPELFPADDAGDRSVTLRRFPFRFVDRAKPDHVQVVALAHSSRARDDWSDRE